MNDDCGRKKACYLVRLSLTDGKGQESLCRGSHGTADKREHSDKAADDVIYTIVGDAEGIKYYTGGIQRYSHHHQHAEIEH